MELNWDCYNDVMLYLEKNLNFETKDVRPNEYIIKNLSTDSLFKNLQYSEKEIYYTLLKLKSDNFIKTRKLVNEIDEIEDITTAGHYYLKQIKQRNKTT